MAALHRERVSRLAAMSPRRVEHALPGGLHVTVAHLPGAAIGSIVWDGALVLARYLGEHPEVVRGARVLELGAGVGLTALGTYAAPQCLCCVFVWCCFVMCCVA